MSLFHHPLTINPCNANGLKNGHKEKTHATGSIVIEELEDVHATLYDDKLAKTVNSGTVNFSGWYRCQMEQIQDLCHPQIMTETSFNITSMSMIRPTKKDRKDMAKRKSSLRYFWRNTAGYISTMAVTRLSTHTNWWKHQRTYIRFVLYSFVFRLYVKHNYFSENNIVHWHLPGCPAPER